jgi:peptidoglycan/xylan/chitin deacetylase (PgdA/CDA1 family)
MFSLALLLLLIGRTPVNADAPNGGQSGALSKNPAFVPLSATVTNRSPCIAAGDSGPYLTLADLKTRVPTWKIKPPVWGEYPTALDDVPLVARTYTPETVEYLATHEVRAGDHSSPYVALTFDCEINPSNTQRILKTLHEEGVQATFFVLGRFAYRNPEIIRGILAEGHEVGNHSFFHPLFTDIPPLSMSNEITYTEAAISWAAGKYVPMRFFRFPYAGRNYATRRHAATLGYQSSFWNMDPRGWEPGKSAKDVSGYVRHRAHGGGIVIMHCGSVDDASALPGVILAIRENGLIPGTLSDVLNETDQNVPGYQLLPDP